MTVPPPRSVVRRAVLGLLAGVLVASLALGGCGDDDGNGANGPCGPTVVEQLDPDGGHLIVGATEPSYLTDPPTSGPHTPGLGVEGGVQTVPLTPLQQVTTLEEGHVIVQYRDAGDAAAAERLAGPNVVVAPNPTLDAAVVATAWARKLTCTEFDAAAIRGFAADVAGQYVGHATTTTDGS